MFDSHFSWLSEVFFWEVCLAPSDSARLRTSDSDGRELWRAAGLGTLNRALFFRDRSDSGADWLRSGSWFSGSEPTFTKAFLVLVKAEVTEPITKKKKEKGCKKRHSSTSPILLKTPLKLGFIFGGRCQLNQPTSRQKHTCSCIIVSGRQTRAAGGVRVMLGPASTRDTFDRQVTWRKFLCR